MKKAIKTMIALWLAVTAFSFGVGATGEKAPRAPDGKEVRQLYAAGTPFGVRFHTEGVVIVGVCEDGGAASSAGLQKGDIIVKIGGVPVLSVSEFAEAVEKAEGEPLLLDIKNGETKRQVEVTPVKCEDGTYKLGVWIKDSAAGIGTVTYIEPSTLSFGGLGHGICDADSGVPIPFAYGTAEKIALSGIVVGRIGAPGELRGSFVGKKEGKLLRNTITGVFGVLTELPEELQASPLDALFPVAESGEVREGKAYIFTTVDGEGRQKYEIEISHLDRTASGRNFSVKVTDPALLSKTGGIVQGMSGSPIIQNGKLIGAVTHVLVSDPTEGYGIFIEKMLADGIYGTFAEAA